MMHSGDKHGPLGLIGLSSIITRSPTLDYCHHYQTTELSQHLPPNWAPVPCPAPAAAVLLPVPLLLLPPPQGERSMDRRPSGLLYILHK